MDFSLSRNKAGEKHRQIIDLSHLESHIEIGAIFCSNPIDLVRSVLKKIDYSGRFISNLFFQYNERFIISLDLYGK